MVTGTWWPVKMVKKVKMDSLVPIESIHPRFGVVQNGGLSKFDEHPVFDHQFSVWNLFEFAYGVPQIILGSNLDPHLLSDVTLHWDCPYSTYLAWVKT